MSLVKNNPSLRLYCVQKTTRKSRPEGYHRGSGAKHNSEAQLLNVCMYTMTRNMHAVAQT